MFSAATKTAQSSSIGPADPYFYDVSLLLNGDGTNGAQNNTFLDSSSNAFTITRNGNTTQGSFSPYGNLWSNYFNQSAFLQSSATGVSNFGTGNYTFECWVNSPLTAQNGIYDGRPAGNGSYFTVIMQSSGQITLISNSGNVYNSATNVPANTWTHIAIVRGGTGTNQCALFINGVRDGTFSDSTSYVDARQVIGAVAFSPYGVSPFLGYISNMRFVKGTAVYSYSNTTITVPTTPLTAISGTSLLTCQSNQFIDNSSNNIALSVYNSGMSVQRFSPFNPTAPYSTTTIGGSGYFDGSTSYLTVANSSNLYLTTDFTIEMWVYVPNTSAQYPLVQYRNGGTWTSGNFQLWINSGGYIFWDVPSGPQFTTSGTVTPNTWTHIAVTRQSGTIRGYINGVYQTSVSDSTSFNPSGGNENFYYNFDGSSMKYFPGYSTDLRINTTTALYTGTGNFTPPTAPETAVSGTALLMNFTNAGIPDLAMQNDLQTVGSAQVSTSVVKYGTGSLSFNGASSNQILTYQNTGLFDFTKPMTIECWFYSADVTTSAGIVQLYGGTQSWSTGSGIEYQFVLYNGSLYWQWNNGGGTNSISSSSGIATNTWIHTAATFDGTTTRLFINGNLVATSTNSYTMPSTRNIFQIGNNGTTNALNGYIDDLRVTSGLARYISNFTPPTAALPTY